MPRNNEEGRRKQPAGPASPGRSARRQKASPLDRKEWGYDPLLGMQSIKMTMSGLLSDLFTRHGAVIPSMPWEPPIDLYEEGGLLIIEMTLPGAQKSDVQMHAYHNLLIISGETHRPEPIPDESYHFHERQWGPFHRSIPLPYETSPENIKANLSDGVLRVMLPFEGKRPSKSVQVKID